MDKEEFFDKIVNDRLAKIVDTLSIKAKEYRRNNNPYHNFERASQIFGETPEKSLQGMMGKHIVSVIDIINDVEKGKYPSIEILDEKIGDTINYLILLEGLIKEKLLNE